MLQILLLIGFEGNDVACLLVDTSLHNCKGSLADLESLLKICKLEHLLGFLIESLMNLIYLCLGLNIFDLLFECISQLDLL